MSLFHCHFFSKVLQTPTELTVCLPSPPDYVCKDTPIDQLYAPVQDRLPVLTLLHGLSGDCTSWLRESSVERYAAEAGVALVMPSAQNSFYSDLSPAGPYFTYIAEEVPRFCRASFGLSPRREQNFIAGLSMGGYGAAKLALTLPERYAAFASLSGALDAAALAGQWKGDPAFAQVAAAFGDLDSVAGSEHDLYALARGLAESDAPLPAAYLCCGTEDFLYPYTPAFADFLGALGFDVTEEEGPGVHDWAFWDEFIQKVLAWLPLPRL